MVVSLNIIINSMFIAGLGSDVLACVGFFFEPISFLLTGLYIGVGIDATYIISKYIGKK